MLYFIDQYHKENFQKFYNQTLKYDRCSGYFAAMYCFAVETKELPIDHETGDFDLDKVYSLLYNGNMSGNRRNLIKIAMSYANLEPVMLNDCSYFDDQYEEVVAQSIRLLIHGDGICEQEDLEFNFFNPDGTIREGEGLVWHDTAEKIFKKVVKQWEDEGRKIFGLERYDSIEEFVEKIGFYEYLCYTNTAVVYFEKMNENKEFLGYIKDGEDSMPGIIGIKK